jgi:hypothetical protein
MPLDGRVGSGVTAASEPQEARPAMGEPYAGSVA